MSKCQVVISLMLLLANLILAEPAYRSRGWRPSGQAFNPGCNQLPRNYGPPPTFAPKTTTTTTTTTRSIEFTTPQIEEPKTNVQGDESSLQGDAEDVNPALAVANSFAFNRPIYVYNTGGYNGFPIQPAYAFIQ